MLLAEIILLDVVDELELGEGEGDFLHMVTGNCKKKLKKGWLACQTIFAGLSLGSSLAAFFEIVGGVLGVVREFGGLTELVGVLRGGSFWKGILSSFWTSAGKVKVISEGSRSLGRFWGSCFVLGISLEGVLVEMGG